MDNKNTFSTKAAQFVANMFVGCIAMCLAACVIALTVRFIMLLF